MDIYDRVSGPGVFIGSCILSGSLLSVRRKNVLPKASPLLPFSVGMNNFVVGMRLKKREINKGGL